MGNRETVDNNSVVISFWLFFYCLCYGFFHIMPTFLGWEIKHKLVVGDVFDIITPFVMIFLIYRLYRVMKSESHISRAALTLAIVGTIVFIEGHGMHLSANAIARHFSSYASQITPLYALVYFFDETLGHIFWDSGIILLSISIMLMGARVIVPARSVALVALGSLIYGFTYFVNAIEGQTVIFTVPVACIICAILVSYRSQRHFNFLHRPVLALFLFSYLVALILFVIWGIWHQGFPEFSELGWI
jgi:uncharacterized membrane protein